MKDVIDVMELQREKVRRIPTCDYRQIDFNGGFTPARFVFECGTKLKAQPLTVATAAILMHKFFKEVDHNNYDPFLVAACTLYLAGKVKDDSFKLRDVINVAHNTLHRGSSPLDLSEEYWNMRDAIVQAELLIMRVLKFEVSIIHPHKYMLHYLHSIKGWLGHTEFKAVPIGQCAMGLLQDFHHDSQILDFSPQHVAIACISLALQIYGINLPLVEEDEESTVWFSIFVKDLTRDKHWEIMEKIMDVYDRENE